MNEHESTNNRTTHTKRSDANRALVWPNVAFMRMPSRLCNSAMQARQGAAGIPMASHTAVANAFMRHNGRKQAAHGQSKPPPTASFDRELRRCGSAALDAEEQATAQLGGQLHRVGVARPVPGCTQCTLHWAKALKCRPRGPALGTAVPAGTGWHCCTAVQAKLWHWQGTGHPVPQFSQTLATRSAPNTPISLHFADFSARQRAQITLNFTRDPV